MQGDQWLTASEALGVLHELRGAGLDADIDLPRICVVGKQSSGKSSVMEALTGISLPRAAGTCTRCAFEISTRKSSKDFSCAISVRCQVDGAESNEKLSLVTMDNPAELPSMLTSAQRLLLNKELLKQRWADIKSGSKGFKDLLADLSQDEANVELFSRDVVVAEIGGKAFTDLELIDLPGLIQSVERDEEKDLISLIEDLCKSYLEKPNTLIAMCCPFNDDMENQAVRMIARRHDPKGQRTVGVLTKADLLQKGTESEWLSIVRNAKFELYHGYFVLRNPSQSELDSSVTSDQARDNEANFFNHDQLGRLLFDAESDRCGVVPLRRMLSDQLCNLIRQELPGLRTNLQQKLRETELRLHDLGKVSAGVRCATDHGQSEYTDWDMQYVSDHGHNQDMYHGLGIVHGMFSPCRWPWSSCILLCVVVATSEVVPPEYARIKLLASVKQIERGLVDAVEAKGDAPFPLWSEVRSCYGKFREACYKARPRFTIEKEELDDHDLLPRETVTVVLRDWDDCWALCSSLSATQRVERDVIVNSQKVPKGFSHTGRTWTAFPSVVKGCHMSGKFAYVRADSIAEAHKKWNHEAWRICANPPEGLLGEGLAYFTYMWCPGTPMIFPVPVKFEMAPEDGTFSFTIPDIRDRIDAAFGRELNLPGGPAGYRAAQQVVKEAQQRWAQPADLCVKSVAQQLLQHTQTLVKHVVGKYPDLQSKVMELLQALLCELKTDLVKRKDQVLLDLEGAPDLYTQNDHFLKDSFNQGQQHIRQSLQRTIQMQKLSTEEKTSLRALLAKAGQQVEDLYAPDPRDDAIWCMAVAHAYHKVSFKRFCDMLPRTVDDALLPAFVTRSTQILVGGLQVMEAGNHELQKWFIEDDNSRRLRQDLEAKLARQTTGLEMLSAGLKVVQR
eukprot:CAMPEP_0204174424 /NCGR_PEP_ID=MMETSP0361-20130328/45863_1 /ASSEMBLY_ACC=CAM_ASM_000343 /TAXON_ID=268821 /ORGANISM="Scrippsiella Hangoei, Strain SHTV-5" /LENGTH=900 /DNA_ID=CAMNT_0051132895 /DNA_START=33 /DNA_END=2735 /DNA_ORIENTATION=+